MQLQYEGLYFTAAHMGIRDPDTLAEALKKKEHYLGPPYESMNSVSLADPEHEARFPRVLRSDRP